MNSRLLLSLPFALALFLFQPGPPPATNSVTFQSTLTGVNVSDTDVAGVSLAGATITVDK